MDNTALMAGMLARIQSEMNGATVESMQQKGLSYPLSYGVSSFTLRCIAKEYAPNHALAELLYKQQVRELHLAALSIASPEQITADGLEFWKRGIQCRETAEHAASFLLYRTSEAGRIVRNWIDDNDENIRYCALLTAVKMLQQNNDSEIDNEVISSIASKVSASDDAAFRRTLGTLLERYAMRKDECRRHVCATIAALKETAPETYKDLEWIVPVQE